jgi:hypothetical protein
MAFGGRNFFSPLRITICRAFFTSSVAEPISGFFNAAPLALGGKLTLSVDFVATFGSTVGLQLLLLSLSLELFCPLSLSPGVEDAVGTAVTGSLICCFPALVGAGDWAGCGGRLGRAAAGEGFDGIEEFVISSGPAQLNGVSRRRSMSACSASV